MATPKTSTLSSVLADVEKYLADAETALALVDKFAAFLPASFKAPLVELQAILTTVQGFLSKI